VHDGADVTMCLDVLARQTSTGRHTELLDGCLRRLDLFRLSRQLDRMDDVLAIRTRAAR
jgi:hypothetical protein